MTQNNIDQTFLLANGGMPLLDPTFPNSNQVISSSGMNDLYTVPAGRRALIGSIMAQVQSSTLTATMMFKVSGTYYNGGTIGQTLTSTAKPGNLALTFPLILEAGETLAVWLSAALSVNTWPQIIEFSNVSPVKSVKTLNLTATNVLCYTAPSTKKGFILDRRLNWGAPGAFSYTTTNASSTSCYAIYLPNGQVVGTAFRIGETVAVAGANAGGIAASSVSSGPIVASSDAIYVNATAANNACALFNVLEL
jgi:hypothetical protein